MSRLWDKGGPLDERVLRFTAGEDHALDNRLVAYDVRASIAHAEMLHQCGLLGEEDLASIRHGLTEIGTAHARGEWSVTLEMEDGQTALETLLTGKIGSAGARLHAGRSRNDQVLAALRLYLRDAVESLADDARRLAEALEGVAQSQGGIALPGYTHMQQAMPSTVGLWALGFAAEIHDDVEALRHSHRRILKNPLGSAAGYGTPNLPVDRDGTRRRLGFPVNHEPVTAVQLSRGKAEAEVLFQVALLMQDLGRLAADLLLFYTREFGFVSLPEAFTTGSSIMPQKRNPDVFELVRGRSATAQACLAEVLGVTAKLPSGYQRDLQLIKAPLFRSLDLCHESLDIMAAAVPQVRFNPERIRLDADIHAAGEANRLVAEEGIPFREAYRRVGQKLLKD
ncbi:MAG TPA: argininosuccinate lyase [Steroidobacteraceae bacterium]|nr:argininosuccinate lyase [Steroidobacteraceae bacterium]